jgi:regulatory protein
MSVALNLLARRDRTVAELRRRLTDKGYGAEDVVATLARLTELGYLDDCRVARTWAAAALRTGRMFGPRLRMELLKKGVPREVAEDVCREAAQGHDEGAAARELLARRYPDWDPATAEPAQRQRLYRFLLRRGVSPSTAISVLGNRCFQDPYE